nr:hypothetical protein [Tawny frogmouth aviadenovirus A]
MVVNQTSPTSQGLPHSKVGAILHSLLSAILVHYKRAQREIFNFKL